MAKKEQPDKNPVGRPSEYDPKYCKQLIAHMAEGFSYESFAGKVGVCRDTLYAWERKHKDFSYTKKVAIEQALLFWEDKGIKGLYPDVIEGAKGPIALGFNSTVWIFNMKNRFGWRDNIEITGDTNLKGKFTFTTKKDADDE